jgi:hypothetical protein
MIRPCITSKIRVGRGTRQPAPPTVRKRDADPAGALARRRVQIESLTEQCVLRISDPDPDYQSIRNGGSL